MALLALVSIGLRMALLALMALLAVVSIGLRMALIALVAHGTLLNNAYLHFYLLTCTNAYLHNAYEECLQSLHGLLTGLQHARKRVPSSDEHSQEFTQVIVQTSPRPFLHRAQFMRSVSHNIHQVRE